MDEGQIEEFDPPSLKLWRDRSQPKALPQHQASGPPVAHRLAATPALGEGDADAAGNGF